MTTEIQIQEIPARRLLIKKTTCAHTDIGSAFAKSINSVSASIKSSPAVMTSPPVAVYLAWRDADTDMAVGCTVDRDMELSEGCEWLDTPAGPNATATHFGPYDTLHETHAAIREWCAGANRRMTGTCWESYPVDPGSEPDAAKWQTEVYYPVQAL